MNEQTRTFAWHIWQWFSSHFNWSLKSLWHNRERMKKSQMRHKQFIMNKWMIIVVIGFNFVESSARSCESRHFRREFNKHKKNSEHKSDSLTTNRLRTAEHCHVMSRTLLSKYYYVAAADMKLAGVQAELETKTNHVKLIKVKLGNMNCTTTTRRRPKKSN